MKVIALNGSPNMANGCTGRLLSCFLDGVEEAGGSVEIFYTRKMEISPCTGELNCWRNSSAHCIHKDDMNSLLPRLEEAEIWVLASPVYFNGVTGPLKVLMDRMLPLGIPETNLLNGHTNHPSRRIIPDGKVVLVSTCGLYEKDNFSATLVHMKAFSKNVDREFAGALLRPHAWVTQQLPSDISLAAKKAGEQLVRRGTLPPDYLSTISRDLVSLDAFLRL